MMVNGEPTGVGCLPFEEFWQEIRTAVRLPESDVIRTSTTLHGDLCLDSLQMLEIILAMDELGVPVEEEDLPSIETVGDLYARYEAYAAGAPRTPTTDGAHR